jgi:starch synthase
MADARRFRILFAASEVVGFAKTGGLADVAGSLPRALAKRGHDVAIVLPLYAAIRRGHHQLEPTGIEFAIPIGERTYPGRLIRTTLPNSTVPTFLVEQPELFERDDQTHGLYQFSTPDGRKQDYSDNAQRYIFFCRTVIEMMARGESQPEILHCNDWQTGLLTAYLRESPKLARVKSLFTIHNIAYQGNFPAETMSFTGLPQKLFNHEQLEFYGQLNFLKAGCVFADALNTVSPRYAQEIQTPEFGCGLEGVLATRRDVLSGIVNGVDYGEWDPSIDRHLPVHYTPETVFDLKPTCKQALQRELHLPERPDVPVLGLVARLVEQKGVSLLMETAVELLAHDVQLIVLGEGDAHVHRWLRELQYIRRQRVGVKIGFDEALAHRIEAGADMFLMPSRYEPSGLNQLYSLRYGTVPVVRSVGGLGDTITDCSPANVAAGTATGFLFGPYTRAAFLEAIRRALNCWHREPHIWRQLVRTGMAQDWSWNRSAGEYERVYARLTGPTCEPPT